MAMTMHVDVVSAEEEIFSGPATMLFAPGAMGDLGIMPRHAPLMTRIKPGEVRIVTEQGDDEIVLYVSGGMLEIQPEAVTILADTAQRASDIDEAAALEAKERAEKLLADQKDDIDYAAASAELAEAMAQLQAISRLRKKVGR
ncbi:MAG: F0F1 ATP synthase subunit epsilon [Gammaproteobacteria bacterium]|nr:F0F1 ATP synthase subunit epsilon [Gammaproteobacteria bacterium]MCF6259355.1 F0F1 ATP synthase subunit epsilon [Gammaproteobacteria bacterium]